ncbi:MAG TPA: sigma-54-dependent Fis family transcriptional regulator [Planctomycetaceae bacterium]|nr:sigma-54-dependent Fis family transcriptional regulator [Planctomycetaceae bacterium]
MAHVLIVDDEDAICWGFAKLVRKMGHTAATAATAEEGLALARDQRPAVVVLDVLLPGMSGLEAMPRFHEAFDNVPVVIMTAHGELPTAVEAVRGGAFDYLVKPFDLDVAQRCIERALEPPATTPASRPAEGPIEVDQMVGTSAVMREVFKRIALVAASDACVHLRAESGTGKELAARAIHRYSRRSAGPFVAINVASLSPTLAESELFGHAKGSFTGADASRKGLLEQADGGTIFLDEVADIPAPIQVKLLRALEHREMLPVGANRPVRSDFRIISATHQNLANLVAEGRFRHDLYFRLITFEIEIPPLREHPDDIGPLAKHFLRLLAATRNEPSPALSAAAMAELRRRPWHGNIRELRNAVEHAVVLARGGAIGPEHLPPPVSAGLARGMAQNETAGETLKQLLGQWAEARLRDEPEQENLYERFLEMVEPPLLEAVLRESGGQCAAAARRLGIHRTTLRKKLDQFGLGSE